MLFFAYWVGCALGGMPAGVGIPPKDRTCGIGGGAVDVWRGTGRDQGYRFDACL